MNCARWLGAALLLVGCGTQQPHETNLPPSDEAVNVQPGKILPPPEVCAPLASSGALLDQIAIAGGAIVATDNAGNVFYSVDAGGFIKLDRNLNRVFAFPYGSVIAVDAQGNSYIAGSFTQPIDLGFGRLIPNGNIDVFVVKLSPKGELLFGTQLGLCGDGVESIAVDSRGRIAVSGTAMGTVILDQNGSIVKTFTFSGYVGFDGAQNLIVAGPFVGSIDFGSGCVLNAASATDTDSFVAKLDVTGKCVNAIRIGDAPLPITIDGIVHTLPQDQVIVSLSVNAAGQIAILGTFPQEMSLFGTTLINPANLPSGTTNVQFIAELDGSLDALFSQPGQLFYARNPPGEIAIYADGSIAVSGNGPSEAFYPYAFARLSVFNPDGRFRFGFGPDDTTRGYGLGVAFDMCGNVYFADSEHDRVIDPLQGYLRLFAR